ncbi:rod shape-determining protein MreC [Patescibacteria group bacterium]|nr:rod shape-determining protein MreC [Patescibacteria group bacterium]
MNSKVKTFLSITTVIFIFICFHYIGWLLPFENFFYKFITPGSQIIHSLSIKINDQEENFESIDDLKTAYQKTKKEIIKMQVEQIQISLLEQENKELKKQLNFLKEKGYYYIGANVIGKNIDPLGNTIILNRGSSDGVKLNNAVIIDEGIIVGKIAKVEKNLSVVRLINDNQSKIIAAITNQDKSSGLVEGGYGISVYMNFIPQNETIVIGDMIITSGLEENIPKGLLIGRVEAVEKEAFQPFQKAIISPLVNLEKITIVSIIIPKE